MSLKESFAAIFGPKVLVASVKADMQKNSGNYGEDKSLIRIHGLVINPGHREVLFHGEPVKLTNTEFGILYYLAKRPGWVFTHAQILDAVRGYDFNTLESSLRGHIVGLRRKLGKAGKYIETIRGIGYRLREEPAE
jgi:two-component system phosphate regulon response regulator PhoB